MWIGKNKYKKEKALIQGCIRKDPEAEKALYDRYSAQFLGICIRYIKDRQSAEDVMIEGFMKIFEKLEQYKGEGSFEGWMRRIIVRQALRQLQKQAPPMEVIGEAHGENLHLPGDLQLGAKELLAMVQQLPLGYRTVFNLYAIEGYSHQEIAEMTGISTSTSKSQLHRARKLLQEMIKPNLTIAKKGHGQRITKPY